MWVIFSITSAFFFAIIYICQKKLSAERSIYSAGWITAGFALPFLAIAVSLWGHFLHLANLPWQFYWPLLIIWFVLYPIQIYFYIRSLREGEFSFVIPLMSILPVFNIFISWILLGEKPTPIGFAGIVLICLSVFILLKPEDKSPFKIMNYSRAGFFMILFCVCVAFGSTFDKISTQVSEPLFYILLNCAGGAIVMGILSFINSKKHDDLLYIRRNLSFVSFIGFLQAACLGLYVLSLKGGLVSYVLAIRSSSFIIAALLGFFLYKEKITNKKIISLALIVIGIIFLAFA